MTTTTAHLHRTVRRTAVTALAVATGAAGLLVSASPSTAAGPNPPAPACSSDARQGYDFDGDCSRPDIALPAPNATVGGAVNAGAVQINYDDGRVQVIDASTAGATRQSGARFGAAWLATDDNADNYTDLIVGAPGTDGGKGAVHVIYGAPGGLGTGPASVTLRAPSSTRAFGASLTLRGGYEWKGLWVGAPLTTVGTAKEAGAVVSYRYGESVTTTPTPTVYTERTKGVPGRAERGDRWGTVLTPVTDGLAIGAPFEDVGSKRDAGSVTILSTRRGKSFTITQNTKRVPGKAETGDRFGAALAGHAVPRSAHGTYRLFVGTPRENLGARRNAGSVSVVNLRRPSKDLAIHSARRLDLGTKRISYAPNEDDQFGAALAVTEDRTPHLWVGAPGRDQNAYNAAGAVFQLPAGTCTKAMKRCGKQISQRTYGVAGSARTNDRFGTTLTTLPGRPGVDIQDVIVGVPGESTASLTRVGVYQAIWGLRTDSRDQLMTPAPSIARSNLAFGS